MQYNSLIYASNENFFLIIKSIKGILPPANIFCSVEEEMVNFLYISEINDIFTKIYNLLKENGQTDKEIGKLFGFSQQHINRIVNSSSFYPEKKADILVKLFFKYFHL